MFVLGKKYPLKVSTIIMKTKVRQLIFCWKLKKTFKGFQLFSFYVFEYFFPCI